ncbi:hypothetical protein AM1_0826 [Acaryochloris marina MBIC11017]|uniref:Uncharacterized protein n=1 Tax=Acaryochloris marina (strain MBIC 11017) TaxID=329726 RepID=B0BYI5_ACAM1|nr:hypothetical protein AM1_0826 [Acaryochloris marina MBIC11017]
MNEPAILPDLVLFQEKSTPFCMEGNQFSGFESFQWLQAVHR